MPPRAALEFTAVPGDDDGVLARFARELAAGHDGCPGVLYEMLWGLPRV